MSRSLFAFAFHAYALGAVAYLGFLIRPWRGLSLAARVTTGVGLLLHGAGLFALLQAQHLVLEGLGQGVSAVTFLLLCIYFLVDLRYRLPVMGAFLTPMALAFWVPGLWLPPGSHGVAGAARFLPLHISVALLGVAAFAVAAGVAVVYLLMEREVKGKRFGLLFSRLPPLQFLDELNRHLVLAGFVALSLTLITGAFFASEGGPFWAWRPTEVATLLAWGFFALVLNARAFAGWRGRRVALLTMAGFCVVLVSFVSSYGAGAQAGRGP